MTYAMQALQVARTGLQALETRLSVSANNLAAAGVDGYKKQYATTADIGYQDVTSATSTDISSASPTGNGPGLQLGLGVKIAGIFRVFQQGELQNTGRPYDLALNGDGFFQILLPDGTHGYTRAGVFNPGPDGTLQLIPSGNSLVPNIVIPQNATDLMVNEQGQVFVKIAGQVNPQQLGQLTVANFVNETGLKSIGDNLFIETQSSGPATLNNPGLNGSGIILQGYREGSNVNSVEEITDLVKTQRGYEMLTKVLHAADDMMRAANNAI